MARTTQDEVRTWLIAGKQQGATHVIVACDTFGHEDYPVFVMPGDDVHKVSDQYDAVKNPDKMTRVMEVYALHLDLESQLSERRAFHYEYAPAEPLVAKEVEPVGLVDPSTNGEPSPLPAVRRAGEVQTGGPPGESGPIFLSFDYEVRARIRLEAADVLRLSALSGSHYDSKCRDFSRRGGIIYGWMSMLEASGDGFVVTLVSRTEVDTLCKILEGDELLPRKHGESTDRLAPTFLKLLFDVDSERARVVNEHPLAPVLSRLKATGGESELFLDSLFGAFGGAPSIDCSCGRTVRTSDCARYNGADPSEREREKRRVYQDGDSVIGLQVGGRMHVVGCPCGELAWLERFVWDFQIPLARYLKQRRANELAAALVASKELEGL